MKNLIDFEKEMTMEVLEERLEMVAHGGSCERKCSGGDGGDGGDTINVMVETEEVVMVDQNQLLIQIFIQTK
jgi:hypothetical protein